MADEKTGVMQAMRETITALIGLTVLTITVWMLVDTFQTGRQPFSPKDKDEQSARIEGYNRQKDVMLYALTLFGTVMGYYFGRVPAELRAQNAQQAADTAQSNLSSTQDKLAQAAATTAEASSALRSADEAHEKEKSDIKSNLARIKPLVSNSVQGQRKTLGATQPPPEALGLQQAEYLIDDLLQRLG